MEEEPEAAQDVAETGKSDLSAAEELFVKLTLEGCSLDECATRMGRGVRTMYRWRDTPKIAKAISAGCQAGLARARAYLSDRAFDVARSLTEIAEGKTKKADPAQVSACRASLEMAVKLGEYSGDGAPAKSEVAVKGGVAAIPVWSGSQADFEKTAMDAQEKLQSASQSGADDGEP